MKKVMRIGTMDTGASIFIKAEYKDNRFSMSGVIGPTRDGNSIGGCGQIDMEFSHRNPQDNNDRYDNPTTPEQITFAKDWNAEKWLDLLDIWHNWHLNDMQPGCEHQRKLNTKEKVELIEYSWSDKYYGMMQKAEKGELTAKEYSIFSDVSSRVASVVTAINRPKYPSVAVIDLLMGSWIKEGKREMKAVDWVTEKEHPKGILSKPCEVCGYKYGSAWLKKEVPADVIATVQSWPNADMTPAWI